MYVIKHVPEDFAVTEISEVKDEGEGRFSIFRLKKRDLTTYEAVSRLARLWRVNIADISCAGNKDRQGVTSQVCSVKGVKKEFIDSLNDSMMSSEFLGVRKEPVHTGELVGNKFCLVVRNVDSIPEIKARFVNLFGEQRFSKRNSSIGRAIVKRDFKNAALMIMEDNPALAPKMKILVDRNDFIGALRLVQRKLLLLFVHAYQSEIWNRSALSANSDILPIVGFDTVIDDSIRDILKEEGVVPRDFVIKEFPEVSSEGSQRNVYAEAAGIKVSDLSDDEFFPDKKKFTIEFMLPKGSYATEFIRQLFEPV
jgi:tRNA(Glu) U13 pseudouridine synthase TruD